MYKKNAITVFVLVGIIAVSLFIRRYAFWLPHWKGDQSHYLSLALKLEERGFNYYNLRGIQIREINLSKSGSVQLAYPVILPDVDKAGDLILALKIVGIGYYDQPFFHKPPAFPFALVLSHKLFAKKGQPYVALVTSLGKLTYDFKPKVIFDAQFYAVVVSLFFSVAMIIATFILGATLFSRKIGAIAAFLIAIHPVDIMTSQRAWADDMLAFFVVASMIVFLMAWRRKASFFEKNTYIVLAGALCGIAVLAKQVGGFLVPAFWLFSIVADKRKSWKLTSLLKVILNKYIVLFTISVFAVSGFWFIKIYRMFGNPFWTPFTAEVLKTDISGWFQGLNKRPPSWLLYPIGIIYLCPLFVLACVSFKGFIVNLFRALQKKECEYQFIFLWFVILTLYFVMGIIDSREHRHMLPVYPSIAILSAYSLERLRIKISSLHQFKDNSAKAIGSYAVIIFLLALCAFWSAPIGVKAVINNQILLRKPF